MLPVIAQVFILPIFSKRLSAYLGQDVPPMLSNSSTGTDDLKIIDFIKIGLY